MASSRMLPIPSRFDGRMKMSNAARIIADVVDEARERHVREPCRRRFQHRLVVAAADEHEVHVGMRALELARRCNDVLLAFLVVVERADVADDQLARVAPRESRRFVRASTVSPLLPLCTTRTVIDGVVGADDIRDLRRDGGDTRGAAIGLVREPMIADRVVDAPRDHIRRA